MLEDCSNTEGKFEQPDGNDRRVLYVVSEHIVTGRHRQIWTYEYPGVSMTDVLSFFC